MPAGKWRHVERQRQRARVTGLRLFSNTFVIRTTRVCMSCLFLTSNLFLRIWNGCLCGYHRMVEGIRVGETSAYGHVSVKGGGRSGAVRGDVMESDGGVKGLLGLMLSGRGKK